MIHKKLISFGIPCYNEELNIPLVYEALTKIAKKNKKYDFEFVFVDNGSTDSSREEINKLAKRHTNVRGIFLSRNFGPEASCQATIDYSRGDAMIGYECDMQDPPEMITELIKKWEEGYDIVVGIRTKLDENIIMTSFRRLYYRILRKISDIDIPVNAGGFSLLNKKTLDELRALRERYRFFRGLRAWVGFKTGYIQYERTKRKYGKSSYNIFDYFNYAIRSFFGFSYLPLDITIYIALFLLFITFVFSFIYLIGYILFHSVINELTIIVFIIIFFSGIQLLAISMIGKYIQVIVEETKNRPQYIVDKIINDSKK